MKHRRYWVGGFVLLVLAGAVWAAVGTAGAGTARHAKTDKVTLQLKWVTQAQFAGYYAAKAKGYYKQQNLDVSIKVGGPDITPETVVAGGAAQFGLDWVPNLLATRDSGTKLVDIGQVFQRSGMTEITWKDTGLNTIAKMRGKKVGNWLGGNQWELFAALTRAGMNPSKNKGVKIVKQPFDMNEINALIWPSPNGIGIVDAKAFARTARISQQFKVIKKAPSGAYRTDLAQAAVTKLKGQGVDVYGRSWKKGTVKVTPGGK